MAGRRMDNGVGGQLRGKQNGLFYHWHGPEYEPDEPRTRAIWSGLPGNDRLTATE